MERILLECSIRALLMALGTALLLAALRLRAPASLHRAWTAVLVAMLLLPFWMKWGPSIAAPVLPAAIAQTAASPAPPRFALQSLALPSPALPSSEAPPAKPGFKPTPASSPMDWWKILLALYIAGTVFMLARLIAGVIRVRSIVRRASQVETFRTSSLCGAPVTIGWLRPTLLLPEDWQAWSSAKLEAVLLHEREHIRRRDPLVQSLALLNRCLFWFHPLAWWLERKLAALAEDACDSAVLSRGHAPADYAGYLIEIARSIHATGARIQSAGAVAFSTGKLPRRIGRIMDAPPVAMHSRARSFVLAILCAPMLATFLACDLRHSSTRAAGQPTMAEQDRNELDKTLRSQEIRRQSYASAWKTALSLTPVGAKASEEDLKAHPGDPVKLLAMVRYYQSKKNLQALRQLTLWYIANHPEQRANWGTRPDWDTAWDNDTFDRGSTLWWEQLRRPAESPYIYMNAAEFLSGNSETANEQAERILQAGSRQFPSSALHWEVFLARHYAWALLGSDGQLPPAQLVFWPGQNPGAPASQSPYAQKIRATLLASNDVDLLCRVVEQLQADRTDLTFIKALNERALALRPDDRMAHEQHDHLRHLTVGNADTNRIAQLQSELDSRRLDIKDPEPKARELLALASRHTNDPDYGTSIFMADTALAEAALSGGNKSEAVRLFLAASAAPPTEHLRYNQLDMSLARNLIDSGERDAVATFLERCAKFNIEGKRLEQWAQQIRSGINPQLIPNRNVFRRAG